MSSSEISALITLIEDPDEIIFSQVRAELVARGEEIIPQLERYWEFNPFGELFQDRIEKLIHNIHYNSISTSLQTWSTAEMNDLLDGAILINKYQYPSFDEAEVRKNVSALRQDIWLELNDNLTAIEQVNVINHILYTVHGFQGNKTNYTAPQNSYIADVLASKKGNPLSLGILYQVIANSLEIPIYGVNLPNHFILAYMDENRMGLAPGGNDNGILFYINPFSGGTIIHKNEVDDFLMHLELPQEVRYYRPCQNADIIRRMVNNLVFAYGQQGNLNKVEELKQLQDLLNAGSSPASA
ncbi:transglutaminase-like domain-containing protein [Sanyastnella coralliicola]|uniref:transglutaminase-like domain-containing protein n=1 Tax=Sanyastnella coralliicola TaxID=3069118 RepID=UPI0027B952C0|nr:transglutaminase-like domain-containing protein [Longitalea sp. SCSIO 12813]